MIPRLPKQEGRLIGVTPNVEVETVKIVDEAPRQWSSEKVQLFRIDASAHGCEYDVWFRAAQFSHLDRHNFPSSWMKIRDDVWGMSCHIPECGDVGS